VGDFLQAKCDITPKMLFCIFEPQGSLRGNVQW